MDFARLARDFQSRVVDAINNYFPNTLLARLWPFLKPSGHRASGDSESSCDFLNVAYPLKMQKVYRVNRVVQDGYAIDHKPNGQSRAWMLYNMAILAQVRYTFSLDARAY